MRALALVLLLATPALAQEAPRDGTWTTTPMGMTLAEACPEAFMAIAGQIAEATARTQSEEIVWGGRFDPSTVPAFNRVGEGQRIDWTRDGETWSGAMSENGQDAGTITLTLLAPDRIDSGVRMDIASMMGGAASGLEGCDLTLDFELRHQG